MRVGIESESELKREKRDLIVQDVYKKRFAKNKSCINNLLWIIPANFGYAKQG